MKGGGPRYPPPLEVARGQIAANPDIYGRNSKIPVGPKLKSTIWAASARQNGLAAAQIRAPARL